jgi:hypothetical protein
LGIYGLTGHLWAAPCHDDEIAGGRISSKRAVTDRIHNAAAVADFLQRALVGGVLDVTQLEARARAAGLLGKQQQIQRAKVFKKAKKSLGIRSIRDGFGGKGQRLRLNS